MTTDPRPGRSHDADADRRPGRDLHPAAVAALAARGGPGQAAFAVEKPDSARGSTGAPSTCSRRLLLGVEVEERQPTDRRRQPSWPTHTATHSPVSSQRTSKSPGGGVGHEPDAPRALRPTGAVDRPGPSSSRPSVRRPGEPSSVTVRVTRPSRSRALPVGRPPDARHRPASRSLPLRRVDPNAQGRRTSSRPVSAGRLTIMSLSAHEAKYDDPSSVTRRARSEPTRQAYTSAPPA